MNKDKNKNSVISVAALIVRVFSLILQLWNFLENDD